jgi:zinc protease
MTLANGLKLIVQPEGISDTISVAGHIRNNPDLEAPKGKEGLDQVLDQLLTYGTASLDRLAFQKALDDIAAANRYAAMTAQQVQAAFAKWIRPGDLVQITEGPNLK